MNRHLIINRTLCKSSVNKKVFYVVEVDIGVNGNIYFVSPKVLEFCQWSYINWCKDKIIVEKCRFCGAERANGQKCRIHEESHLVLRFCYCLKSFLSNDSLLRHKRGDLVKMKNGQVKRTPCKINSQVQEFLKRDMPYKTPKLVCEQ